MSEVEATLIAIVVGVCLASIVISTILVFMAVKLYTEFVKEAKYREPR